MSDTTTAEKLARLHNRATLYELTMSRGDEHFLIAYASNKGRTMLWKCVTSDQRVHQIIAKTGTEAITFAKRAGDGATMGAWAIRFTGRTQRDAISQGELPYIGDQS